MTFLSIIYDTPYAVSIKLALATSLRCSHQSTKLFKSTDKNRITYSHKDSLHKEVLQAEFLKLQN